MSETFTTYGIGPDKQFDELQTLRDERDRLARRVKDLEGRFKLVGKYMANGRIQQAHDLAKDTVVAMYMTEAAMTPAGGGRSNGLSSVPE